MSPHSCTSTVSRCTLCPTSPISVTDARGRPAAVRALRRIDPQDRLRIRGVIALLGENPRPPGAKALQGGDGMRVRVGNYLIVYTINDDVLLVVVVTLGRRKDVYGG